jgi:2-C-methyl-D-erythritol 4-phosphate cytidylyltransferase
MTQERLKNAAQSPNYVALLPAAGVGSRLGATMPKQYLLLAGQAVLQHTINSFLSTPEISHVFVLVHPDDAMIDTLLDAAILQNKRVTILRCGGTTRRDTVRAGLDYLATSPNLLAKDDWILVHDAARPGITPVLIQQLLSQVGDDQVGGLLALPVVDTVKRLQNGKVTTIDREGLWLAQTPQMFRYQLLCDALDNTAIDTQNITDEASAIEAYGCTPILVQGELRNRKLTLPEDVALLQKFLE